MMVELPRDLAPLKRQARLQTEANRRHQQDKDHLSREICGRLAALSEYAQAATVMFYLDIRDEVRTRHFLPTAWQQGKQIVVPYCVGERLDLFRLESLDELAVGTFGILEPKPQLRNRTDRKVDLSAVDLIVVPGLAFDRQGGRLGRGQGYYDKLLHLARPDTALVALAFECQLLPSIPMLPHDVYMDKVVTEKAVYETEQQTRGLPS
jgi:5-formyltetrahydrofolate cyclo-ligase